MSEVKRYGHQQYNGKIWLDEREDGKFCSYDDYAALKAECENWSNQCAALIKERDALAAENAALKSYLKECSVVQGEGNWTSDAEKSVYIPAKDWMPPTPATDAYLNSVRAEVIPEGYVIVPQQMHLSADAMESLCFHFGDGGFAFGDFTDGLLWVGDIENDDGTKTYGLNIATAEYPEEGIANISEFAAQLRAGKDGE